jgi:transcriptional regulator with XRE-family HTH domain
MMESDQEREGHVARYPANHLLRQARVDTGLSQDELAERLGEYMRTCLDCNVSPSGNLVGMWERGEARPGRVYRRGLAAFTGLDEAALGLGPPPPAPPARALSQEEAETNRREMLSGITAAGLALSGFSLPPLADVPRRVGPQHVAELGRLTEMYRTMTYSRGADAEPERGVSRLLDRAVTLLGQVSSPQLRRELLDAAADIAGLAAYACRDLGQHDWAQQYYLLAMQAAQAAGDHALAGHLVVRMAGHNIELAQPGQVLSYLQAARQPGNGAHFTPGQLSNQHAIAAWANAQAGSAQAVLREAGQAEDHFANAGHHAGPDWQVRHVAEAELYSLTGAGYTELARHQPRYASEAITRLTAALDLRGDDVRRNATLDTISLAEAHLADRDLPQALAVADSAVTLASDSASRRVRKRLGELAAQLQPHQRQPGTAQALEQIRTLTPPSAGRIPKS